MNLNPDNDHIIDYTTGWDDNYDIGETNLALVKYFLSQEVWNLPDNSVAIVYHREVLDINLTKFFSKNIF